MLPIILHLRRAEHRLFLVSFLLISEMGQAETWFITERSEGAKAYTNARIIFLDDQHRLENMLTQALPDDPSLAPETIQHYLSSFAGKRLQNDLTEAQQGITDAWSLGIEKIPAVVVDRRYVIYGETDVAKAVERINQARGSSQ